MAKDFQPSSQSLSPKEVAKARLKYMRKALDVLDESLQKGGDPPAWVLTRLAKAAQLLGMAVSYASFADKKRKS